MVVAIKKFCLFVLVILIFNSVALAYLEGGSNLDVVVPKEDEKRTTTSIFVRVDNLYINNKGPITNLNYPTDSIVVSGNLVEFGWRYSDPEGNSQVNYVLEIDDDPRFLSPLTYYGFSETTRKVYIVQGNKDYYWRVKSKDDFGWGQFSDVESFYSDTTRKVCEGGTQYSQCSAIDFRYCDFGELRDNCKSCGCPLNSICTMSGVCVEKTCFDGTKYGFCNLNKQPNFCQNGVLKEVCSLCGCPDGKECQSDGTCSTVTIKEERSIDKTDFAKSNLIFDFFNFFKSIFSF